MKPEKEIIKKDINDVIDVLKKTSLDTLEELERRKQSLPDHGIIIVVKVLEEMIDMLNENSMKKEWN